MPRRQRLGGSPSVAGVGDAGRRGAVRVVGGEGAPYRVVLARPAGRTVGVH
ncbi:hypothetical protein ACFWN1_21955 [Streptomyces sp. NPDC058459]|uniref:hypothetical protein n=1 Tax=Streptomyces sp. NPDC058459 TaxID=3346508 RepID=UPI003663C802